jgi:hypothetical protein
METGRKSGQPGVMDTSGGAGWQSVCGSPYCPRGGPCVGRENAARQLCFIRAVELLADGRFGPETDDEKALSAFRAANIWLLSAAVCELPADDPRRAVAAHLLAAGWHWSSQRLTQEEQDAAAAELLDTAEAVLS